MISPGETMEKVKVSVKDLIEKIEVNFERHKKDLAQARIAYKKKALELLKENLKTFETLGVNENSSSLYVMLKVPEDHCKDYDRAIQMLKMSQDDTVILTSTQFAAFVQDEWHWKSNFSAQITSYA